MTPEDTRRAIRTAVYALVAVGLTALGWYITYRVGNNVDALREIARWSLAIVGLDMMGYIMETGLRSLKVSKGADGSFVLDAEEAAHADTPA